MASSSNAPPESPFLSMFGGDLGAEIAAKVAAAQKGQVNSKEAVMKKFAEIVRDPESLDAAAEYLYESLIDDAALGIFIENHRLWKFGKLSLEDTEIEKEPETEGACGTTIVELPNVDIFGTSTTKKPVDIICPNCERTVTASRFAPHLEKCMGMGRISSRVSSRRLATKEGASTSAQAAAAAAAAAASSSYAQATGATDDEDDVDWSSEKRRKKPSQGSKNSKKNNSKSN